MNNKLNLKTVSFAVLSAAIILFSFNINAADNTGKENTKLPMLWDFGAKKCIPCKMMMPILEKMTEEYKDCLVIKFTDVWISENVKTAKEHGIRSIPTQIFFDKNGKEIWRHVGFISEADLLAKWKSLGYDFSKCNTANKSKDK